AAGPDAVRAGGRASGLPAGTESGQPQTATGSIVSAESTGTEVASGDSTAYIQHHLQHLQWQVGESKFMTINVDSVVFSLLASVLFLFFFLRTSRKATPGVPGTFQAVVELVVGFVDGLVRETFHGRSKLIAPL